MFEKLKQKIREMICDLEGCHPVITSHVAPEVSGLHPEVYIFYDSAKCRRCGARLPIRK